MLSQLKMVALRAQQQHNNVLFYQSARLVGKTESPHKYKTPKLKMKSVNPIYPPPGMNLKLPENLDVNTFFRQIGGDCEEYADKFEEGGLQ